MEVRELDLRELLILGLLAEVPRHAYEIEQCVEKRHLRAWTTLGFSSIYTLLARLETRGLAVSLPAPGEPGRPARRVYRPTEDGRQTLAERVLRLLGEPTPQQSPVTLALMLSMSAVEPERVAEALDALSARADERIAEIDGRRQQVPPEWRNPIQDALFRHDLALLEAERTWATETAALLRE